MTFEPFEDDDTVEFSVIFRLNLKGKEGEKKSFYSIHWFGYALILYRWGFYLVKDDETHV